MQAKFGANGIYNLTEEYPSPVAPEMPIWKQVERSDGSQGGGFFVFWNEHPNYWSIGDIVAVAGIGSSCPGNVY